MAENVRVSLRPALGLAFVVLLVAGYSAASAQGVLTGEWTASLDSEKADKIHLNFERRTGRRGSCPRSRCARPRGRG